MTDQLGLTGPSKRLGLEKVGVLLFSLCASSAVPSLRKEPPTSHRKELIGQQTAAP